MTEAEVVEKLQSVFDRVFLEPVKVTPELTAEDVPEWDSLTHISLVAAIEKTFSIHFRVGEVQATKSVGEFAALIVKKIASAG